MTKKKQERVLNLIFIFLLLAYSFLIGERFLNSLADIDSTFGYVDYQSNWRVLEGFLRGKVPFRDYYHSYGLFFMFLQAPAFIFGRNFLSLLISRNLYLPLISLGISYFVAKKILRKKSLILIFLFFCFLFWVNYLYESPRHLVAELSLSLFILSLLREEKSGFLSGLIAGLALLTSLEYGIALNLTIGLLVIIYLFSRVKNYLFRVDDEKRQAFGLFKEFLLGEMIILFPFFTWLFFSGSLTNYWHFTFGFINNFYYASPCSGYSFPRLEEIYSLRSTSPLLIFGLPISFLQRLNLYLNIIFLLIMGFVSSIFFISKKYFSKRNFLKIGLVIYGLLISIRTLDNPCLGYFSYSLVPTFLLITLLMGEFISWAKRKKPVLKILVFSVVLVIFSWLVLTEHTGYLVKIFGKNKQLPKESFARTFYPPAGWWLRSDLVENYQQITNYVVKNTNKNDYLYVYPWGVYNQLTNRRSPTGANNALQLGIVGEKLISLAQKELEQKKPKLVIINTYNNLGVAHYGLTRGDVSRYYALADVEGPVFAGEGDPIQKYILENYESVLKNDLAVVMKQRAKPVTVEMKEREIGTWRPGEEGKIELQFMEKKGDNSSYEIFGKNASWSLTLKEPIEAFDVAVEFKFDGDFLTKHLSRYFVNLYALDERGEELSKSKVLARKIWQTDKIYFDQPRKIKTVKIETGDNTGLIWWLNPYNLEIKEISFYK